jgi:hypothetical protein
MSAIWESANWTRQFGIRQTGNQQLYNVQNCLARNQDNVSGWTYMSTRKLLFQ